MGISLTKQQTISLEKGGAGLTRVFLGLGWDVAKAGGLRGLFGGGGGSIDLDASCVVFTDVGEHVETVYFGHLTGQSGAIRHGGDNLTGAGDGDDERIFVDLSRLPAKARTLIFTVNSFRGQTFDKVANAFARVVDEVSGQEIARLNLSEQGSHTGLVMVKLVRNGSTWSLTALGDRLNGRTAAELVPALSRYL
ncbi:TerD family protein [Deinococcus maricopensis]|uniref:Stress protein n=1 Tax=Deinococcus maricopensis (strain DSM 21211 / LMG 22137 / NRRL B-23946 / LB-34) TaxID=709986 RepID=E8U9R7_DEIML|nr:TerD family protein [Deinococcus maricopensis]ADV67806.1 stress protein [Deinococcus maricopensis DSM 21211]